MKIWNYVKGQWEDCPDLKSGIELRQYIPNTAICQTLYELYRKTGKTPIAAMREILERLVR